jgi:hypothetical protein
MNKQRAFSKMLNEIETHYGKDAILLYGDWSISNALHLQMRNFISTPNIGIKRQIMSKFETYDIDEYRTSKLYHRTQTEATNHKMKINNKERSLHAVLTFNLETIGKAGRNRQEIINRDKNSCMNMRKIFKHYLKTSERLERYRRGIDTDKNWKPIRSNERVRQVSVGLRSREIGTICFLILQRVQLHQPCFFQNNFSF